MPRIDFYLLQTQGEKARLDFACKLIEKAYKNRHRIYINTDNSQKAQQLDELLWTYKDESFLPHNLYGEGPDNTPPIQIGCHVHPQQQRDILINLSKDVPDFFTQFTRVIELVTTDPEIQTTLRDHYKLYRAKGYEITTHKLQMIEA